MRQRRARTREDHHTTTLLTSTPIRSLGEGIPSEREKGEIGRGITPDVPGFNNNNPT